MKLNVSCAFCVFTNLILLVVYIYNLKTTSQEYLHVISKTMNFR
jgi:hypothetical protein